METITSRTNERVKGTRALQRAKERKERGLHLAEGEKLVREALTSGCTVREVYLEEGFGLGVPVPEGTELVTVTRPVMEVLCEAKTPQHAVAVVETPDTSLPGVWPEGLIVLLDCVQDPGNVGTVIRTADALGASAVVLGTGTADPFSVKTIRASMGSSYHMPLYEGDIAETLGALKKAGFTAVCGHLHGSETLPETGKKCALVIGNEGNGVSDAVADECVHYRLPMRGRAESLNAAVAAALLIDRFINQGE
ncbi:MAG: RNA methyltransferase [Clostridia bacterium]|nr:RNA methyltransferase [Clostridia bacterium]